MNLGKAKSSVGILRRELAIHNFHFPKIEKSLFYDFGPNRNYWECLKALRVVLWVQQEEQEDEEERRRTKSGKKKKSINPNLKGEE